MDEGRAEKRDSAPRIKWQTSFGTLLVKVVEGSDLFHPRMEKRRNLLRAREPDPDAVLIRVGIQNEDAVTLREYSCQMLYNTNQNKGGIRLSEEFCFEDVCSFFSLQLSLYKFTEGEKTTKVGSTSIPVSRLRENQTIEQYYSMQADDGTMLRSAVLLRLSFVLEGVKIAGGIDISPRKQELSPKEPVANEQAAAVQHSNYSLFAAEGKADGEAAADGETDHRLLLPTGLIDYCLIAGPVITEHHLNTPRSASTPGHDRLHIEVSNVVADGGVTMHLQHQADPLPDVVRPMNGVSDQGVHVAVWETFPIPTDDLPVPTKIEWFCFPNGARLVSAATRPEETVFTFIMVHGTNVTHGVCLHFFVRWPGELEEGMLAQQAPATDEEPLPVWAPCCVCFLTRDPFVGQLKDILSSCYRNCVEPRLAAYDNLLANPRKRRDNTWRNLLRPLEAFIVQLCLEAPLPFPGCFDVTAQIFDLQLKFAAPQMSALPHCCYDINQAARLLGPRTLLDLVCCALNEVKLLFYSKDIARLPVICEAVRTLLYPFQWEHVYVPVLPFLLLDLIQAPLPFILGIHVDCLKELRPEVLRDVVVVNCDTGGIETSAIRIEPLPPMYDRWLLMAIRALVYPELNEVELAADISQAVTSPTSYMLVVDDDSLATVSHDDNDRQMPPSSSSSIDQNQAIQLAFMDMMADLLQYLPHCLFFLHSTPIFNRSLFLNNFLDEDRRGFMMKVIDSQSFHRLIENIQDPFVSFFLQSIDRGGSYSNSGQSTGDRRAAGNGLQLSEEYTIHAERLSSLSCIHDAVMRRLMLYARNYKQTSLAALELDVLLDDEKLVPPQDQEQAAALSDEELDDLPLSALRARQQLRAESLGNLEDDYVPPPEAFKKVKSEMVGSSAMSQQTQRTGKRASYSTLTSATAPKESLAAIELQRAIQKVYEKQQSDARTPSVASSTRSRSPSFVGAQEQYDFETERSSFARSIDDHSDEPGSIAGADMFDDLAVGLVGFDWRILNAHSGGVRVWTIEEISTLLHLDPAVVSQRVDVVGKPSVFQQLSAQFANQPIESPSAHQVPSNDEQDEHRIQSCLATAFSATQLSEAAIQDLTIGCAPVLRHQHVRNKLLSILRQPYRSNGSLGIYPLHSSAFEVLARLCFYMLQACAEDEDRVSAYHLLTLAGCYYQTAPGNKTDGKSAEDAVEFLSARICHHPFYQDPALWRDVLLSNMGQEPGAKLQQVSRTRAAQEIRSILYEMMNLGVNKHRATHFAQTLASEFRLTLDQFLAIQRHIAELWIQQPQAVSTAVGDEPIYDFMRTHDISDASEEKPHEMERVGASVRLDEKEAEQHPAEDEKKVISTEAGSEDQTFSSPTLRLGRSEALAFEARIVENLEHDKAVTAIDMLGCWVVTGCAKGLVCISDVLEGQCILQLAAHTGQVTRILCTPAGIITAGHDHIIKIWRYPWLPELTAHRSAHCSWGVPVCFQLPADTDSLEAASPRQPNLQYVHGELGLLSSRAEGRTLLNMSKTLSHFRMSVATISLHQHPITSVDFAVTSDGRYYMATADAGGVARVWDGTAGSNFECLLTGTLLAPVTKILLVLPAPSLRVSTAARPEGASSAWTDHACVVGTQDGQLAVFDIVNKKCTFSAAGHDGPIIDMQRTHSSEVLTCAGDRSVRLWDIRAETSSISIYGHAGPVTCMTAGGWQDSVILTGSADGVIRIWDTRVDTAQPYAVLRGHTDRITALWWDGSGMLLSAGYDGMVRQWDVFAGTCLLTLQGHAAAGITDFVCSRARPSGRDMTVSRLRSTDSFGSELVNDQFLMRLVTVAWDGTVRLWESSIQIPFRL